MTVITRKQYLTNKVSHDQYYGQPAFCTPEVKSMVARAIGLKRILESTEPHFNDIPLRQWDDLHPAVILLVGNSLREANGTGGIYGTGGISLSDTVCIAKAAARLIKEPQNA